VRASQDGRVTGLNISVSEIVAPAQALFTLINTEEWVASANFRNRAAADPAGSCATVCSMVDRTKPLKVRWRAWALGCWPRTV
jgi:multidrug efflux system membrane fusion protein